MTDVRVFRLPDVGEGLTEAEVLHWLVGVGDRVEVNATLVEIETAKASVELPSPFAGVVARLHVAEGAIVPVGTPIVSIEVAEVAGVVGGADASPAAESGEALHAPAREAVLVGYGVADGPARRRRRSGAPVVPSPAIAGPPAHGVVPRPRAKPLVRRLARELGVDLRHVAATGPNGDVTRADVRAAADRSALPPGEQVPVRGVRRAMAAAMTTSAATAPQAAVWVQVDVTGGLARLARLGGRPDASGVRLTPLVLAATALLDAIAEQPLLHAVWHEAADGPVVVIPERVGLGVAANTERGLVVPVVHDPPADPVELARAVAAVVELARSGQARPADFVGGTITLTNVGVFGIDGGLPILTPGQAAILAVGQVASRPWVVDGQVVARPVVELTMTFDHRVLDGAQASAALRTIATALSAP